VTNLVTIAAHTQVHQRTLTDTQAQVGYENAHHRGLRTWRRDEEAAGPDPVHLDSRSGSDRWLRCRHDGFMLINKNREVGERRLTRR
jgi:hypothetical protein